MTLPVWPDTLPEYVLREGFQAAGVEATVRTEMEDGPGYVRRKRLNIWTPVEIRLFLRSAQQVTELKGFWRNTLNCGQSRFTAPIYTFEGTGSGYVLKTCMWDGPGPTFTPYGGPNQPMASFRVKVLDF